MRMVDVAVCNSSERECGCIECEFPIDERFDSDSVMVHVT